MDGTEFAAVMAHKLCSAVAAAADDVAAVFGDDTTDLTALFMVWALGETDRCALSHNSALCHLSTTLLLSS